MDCLVKKIKYEDTKPFILNIHYARRMPSVSYAFGAFINDEIIGVITYGQPASPSLCKGIAGVEYRHNVLELNRLVILPKYNGKNIASYLISKSLKMLPPRRIIVSYADVGGWSHCGYVYQASNFLYTGTTKPRTDKYGGENGHSRHYAEGEERRQIRTAKHRYVAFTGTKTDKKELRSKLKYPVILKYPKSDNINYDVNSPKPFNEMLGKII